MSSLDLTSVLVHSRAIGTAKVVLLGIAYHTGKDRLAGCYPSQETLAAYAGVSTRQVRRAIDQLVDLGELRVDVRASWKRGNLWYTNLYFINELCSESCEMHQHVVRTSMAGHEDT
jgi:hypothetical protein